MRGQARARSQRGERRVDGESSDETKGGESTNGAESDATGPDAVRVHGVFRVDRRGGLDPAEVGRPLYVFEMTVNEFRLLSMLYEEGPMSMSEAAEERGWQMQNLHTLADRAVRRGWIKSEVMMREPVEIPESQLPKARRGQPRKGRKIRVISLTEDGKVLIDQAIRRQAKWVKGWMRALDLREQATLARLCEKLRLGDREKTLREIRKRYAKEDLRAIEPHERREAGRRARR